MTISTFKDRLIAALYPGVCPICGKIAPYPNDCCETCSEMLPYIKEPLCRRCGKELTGAEQEFCYDCSVRKKSYTLGLSVFRYSGVQRSLTDLKFHNRRSYAQFFGREIAKVRGSEILQFAPEAIIPVPMYRGKQMARGYNQAELIARRVAGELGIPVRTDVLVRNRQTAAQKTLGSRERTRNLEAAFAANQTDLARVVLLDDIYTTGATAEACSRVLRRAGVREICVVTAAIGEGMS